MLNSRTPTTIPPADYVSPPDTIKPKKQRVRKTPKAPKYEPPKRYGLFDKDRPKSQKFDLASDPIELIMFGPIYAIGKFFEWMFYGFLFILVVIVVLGILHLLGVMN